MLSCRARNRRGQKPAPNEFFRFPLAPQKTTKTEKPTTETTTPVITPPTNDETEENRVECDYIGNSIIPVRFNNRP